VRILQDKINLIHQDQLIGFLPNSMNSRKGNPIEATKAGYHKYNDTIANYISDDYILYLKDHSTYFLEEIGKYYSR